MAQKIVAPMALLVASLAATDKRRQRPSGGTLFSQSKHDRRRRPVLVVASGLSLLAAACGSTDQAAPTITEVADIMPELFEGFGNENANTVVVNAQGGPTTTLLTSEVMELTAGLDLEDVYVVNVHQAQTLSPEPFVESDISFEAATIADVESVAQLATVVEQLKDEGKTVYVLGVSFGAFLVQGLLATQGNVADGYLIAAGRLEMPEEVWTVFAEGRAAGFSDGETVIEFAIEEAGMGAGTPAGDRNMARLAAGLGQQRFTETLAEIDLTNVTYIYGETDEQVGRLTETEISFLTTKGVRVVSNPGGHEDAIEGHVPEELRAMLGNP